MSDNNEWKSYLAQGVAWLLICIGFGSCIRMTDSSFKEPLIKIEISK